VGDFVGGTLTFTPLFQYRLLPNFMQVYFLPLTVLVSPDLEHLVPAISAANVPLADEVTKSPRANKKDRNRFIC
jgi:hypothetical protein